MKASYKILIFILLIVMGLSVLAGCQKDLDNGNEIPYGENVLSNGDFETGTSGWSLMKGNDGFVDTSVKSTPVDSEQYNPRFGARRLEISNLWSATYCYYMSTVELEKGVIYKLSIDINVTENLEGVSTGASYTGAFVAFDKDSVATRINVTTKTSGFVNKEFYFKPNTTGPQSIIIGLGRESAMVKGAAQFDNVTITPMQDTDVALGTTIYTLGATARGDYATDEGITFVVLLSILSVALCLLAYYLIKLNVNKNNEDIGKKLFKNNKLRAIFTSTYFYITFAILAGFIVRFIIVNFINGMNYELNSLANFSSALLNKGSRVFYENNTNAALPIGQLYMLWGMGHLASLFGVPFGSTGFFILLKIPAIIADLVLVFFIYEYALKNHNSFTAFIMATLYAILPVVFTISSAWGQFTAIPVLFIILSIISFIKRKPILSISLYTIAVFFDPIVLAIAPLFIGVYVIRAIRYEKERIGIIATIPASFIFLFLVNLPFSINFVALGEVFFFITKMSGYIVGTAYYTTNAFNLFGLFGNNTELVSTASQAFNIIFTVVLSIWLIYVYYNKRNRLEMLLYISLAFLLSYVFNLYNYPYYVLLAIASMFMYFVFTGEKRVFICFTLLSFTSFINLAQILNHSGYIGTGANTRYLAYVNGSALLIIFSIINIIIAIVYTYLIFSISYENRLLTIEEIKNRNFLNYFKREPKKKEAKRIR